MIDAKEIVRERLALLKDARDLHRKHSPDYKILSSQINEAAEILSLIEKAERRGTVEGPDGETYTVADG